MKQIKIRLIWIILILFSIISIISFFNVSNTSLQVSKLSIVNRKTGEAGEGTQANPWIISASDTESDVKAFLADGVLTIKGTGKMKGWTMDNTDPAPWFESRESINSVTIEEGVTNIGNCAFNLCTNLVTVNIPSSVTIISETSQGQINGGAAFSGCTSLQEINVGENNTTYKDIDGILFSNSGDTLIKYPGGRDGNYTIGNTVKNIDSYAFDSSKITSMNIPNTVTKIGISAFQDCRQMESITISEAITNIDHRLFYQCDELKSITLPKNIQSIGDNAFYNCFQLKEVIIPQDSQLKTINKEAFMECRGLETIELPNTIEYIGNMAFYKCRSLRNFSLPLTNITNIGSEILKSAVLTVPVKFSSNETEKQLLLPQILIDANDSDSELYDQSAVLEPTNCILNGNNVTLNHSDLESGPAELYMQGGKLTNFTVKFILNNVSGIEVKTSPTKTTYKKGETLDLIGGMITVTYEDGSTEDMNMNPNYVTGYNSDTLGEQTITVTYEGKSATFNITVVESIVEITGVTIEPTILNLNKGESRTLSAIVTPSNANIAKTEWESDKPNIATVNTNGLITAVSVGEANITVNVTDAIGNVETAICKVTVIQSEPDPNPIIEVTEISLNKSTINLNEGETERLILTIEPENADIKEIKWESNTNDIATVDQSGVITAVKTGETTITVTVVDKKGNTKTKTSKVIVTEENIELTKISLNNDSLNLNIGETGSLVITKTPQNATIDKIVWKSSNESVAKVDNNGRITAVGEGKTTITVNITDKDGNTKTATCEITVVNPNASGGNSNNNGNNTNQNNGNNGNNANQNNGNNGSNGSQNNGNNGSNGSKNNGGIQQNDSSLANSIMPKTGINKVMMVLMVIMIVNGIVMLVCYKKIKY